MQPVHTMPTPAATLDPSDFIWHLSGNWTLAHANAIQKLLNEAPENIASLDARKVEALDSSAALQLIHFAAQRQWRHEQSR